MARRKASSKTQKIVESIVSRKANKILDTYDLIPTSSTLLNLACSDSPYGGFASGRMVNLIGDSSSGKSIVALTLLALCANNPKYKNYRLIYDDVENANSFDLEYLFGKTATKRIEAAFYNEDDVPIPSQYIEDFHCNIADALEDERPFIYVLDSFDALDAEQDAKKIEEIRNARRKNLKVSGTYSMAKPKKSSEILRNITADLKKTESVLIIISQTRDNINPISFETKTRSGGNALRFYATHEIWLAKAGGLKGKGQKRLIGNKVKAKIKKNKLTGKVREVNLRIYYDYGVDDIIPNIEFLVTEKHWKKSGNTIKATDFRMQGTLKSLVAAIESAGYEKELQLLVAKKWLEIEEELKLDRKPRFK